MHSSEGSLSAEIYSGVVLPVVEVLGGGEAAAQLVYRTGLAESGYRVTRQVGGGPALGYWQMEPATEIDIQENFLEYRPALEEKLWLVADGPHNLETNHMYACAMCRVHYMRVSAPLPDADDLEAQAAYWKQHYNTPLGAGTVEHFMEACSHVAD